MKKIVSLILCCTMFLGLLASCSDNKGAVSQSPGQASSAGAPEIDRTETLKIVAYNEFSWFHGDQLGWFAKIVKDKFNIEVNVVSPSASGGGDSLFQTRSASGELGDIIMLDSNKIADCLKADLYYDMSKDGLFDKYAVNLKSYMGAVNRFQKDFNTEDKIYVIPMQVSNQTSMEPMEGNYLNNGAFIRFDYYKELGSPVLNTMDDLIPMFTKMKEMHPKTEDGKTVYPFSLFKDWDGLVMNAPLNFMYINAEEPLNFGYAAINYANDMSVSDTLAPDSSYIKGLKFFYDANKAGLLDPDSPTQNFDSAHAKIVSGQALFTFWAWQTGGFNDVNNNKENGRGLKPVEITSQKILATGGTPNGQFRSIGMGKNVKDPARVMEFIDWLYSPEYSELAGPGIKGLNWDIKDGEPYITDFLKKDGPQTIMPEEYGKGTYQDGVPTFTGMFIYGINPNTNRSYDYATWPSVIKNNETQLDRDWSEMYKATTQKEFLKNKNQMLVIPGTDFTMPNPSSDLQTAINQIKPIVCDYSWKMIYAKDEKDFDALYNEMMSQINEYGYQDVLKFYIDACNTKIDLMKKAIA